MKKVFIIHGYRGIPNSGWKSWLMAELAKKGIYACALPMPTPEKPIKSEWVEMIKDAVSIPSDDIYLVGHSLGVPAVLRYLEYLDKDSKIGGALLIAGPVAKIEKKGHEQVNTFLETRFDFDHIKNACHHFTIIHGENDQAVSFYDAGYLTEKVSGLLIPIPGGGHFSSDENCIELPEALDALLRMMKISN
jgi:predicted alpha/beta hydrolase family esterase